MLSGRLFGLHDDVAATDCGHGRRGLPSGPEDPRPGREQPPSFDLLPHRLRWAAAEGVSEGVIAAVLLLHERSQRINANLEQFIKLVLDLRAELEKVIELVGRSPRLYPRGILEALHLQRSLLASPQPAESVPPNDADPAKLPELFGRAVIPTLRHRSRPPRASAWGGGPHRRLVYHSPPRTRQTEPHHVTEVRPIIRLPH
jgi:hypothetical protein